MCVYVCVFRLFSSFLIIFSSQAEMTKTALDDSNEKGRLLKELILDLSNLHVRDLNRHTFFSGGSGHQTGVNITINIFF